MLILALTITAAPASAAHKSRDLSNHREAKNETINSEDNFDQDDKIDFQDDYNQDSRNNSDENWFEYKDSKEKNEDKSSYHKLWGKSVSDGKPGTGHRFPYGQCTWYIAMKKYIPWSGNAGTWLEKAKRMGFATGWEPKEGSVAVFGGSYFGHVGLVEKVNGNQVAISEMNYQGFGRVSHRNISANDPKLKGFIY